MNFSGRTNTVVKAERGCNRFAGRTVPLSILTTNIALGFRSLEAKQLLFGLPLLPPAALLANDKVVGGMQHANSAILSGFRGYDILKRDRRGLVKKFKDRGIVLHQIDSSELNGAAFGMNDHTHFSARVADRDILASTSDAAGGGRGSNACQDHLRLARETESLTQQGKLVRREHGGDPSRRG